MHRRATLTDSLTRLDRGPWLTAITLACGIGLALTPVAAGAQGVVVTEQLERSMFRAADIDGDGFLDEAEFAADVIAAFVALDADGDGVLTPAELAGVDAARFAAIDSNGDGVVSVDEVRVQKLNAFTRADRDLDGRVSMAEMLFRPRREV